jgi:hypothetical protein
MCLVHIFEIREAKIAKEIALEMRKVVLEISFASPGSVDGHT